MMRNAASRFSGSCGWLDKFKPKHKLGLWDTIVALATIVAAHVVSFGPSYLFINSLRELESKPDWFYQCTDVSPCEFTRFFSSGGVPGTFPDVLSVQNGQTRPLMILPDTFDAYPVLPNIPVPRTTYVASFFGCPHSSVSLFGIGQR